MLNLLERRRRFDATVVPIDVALFEPHRGDEVEAWIKRERDRYGEVLDLEWHALDDLLDNYREHADTGTPLHVDVQGPHGEDG